ncbi:MAG: hypothetical protein CMM93_02335 [Rickettsiales bacterium]|nr:hypothetical protein [Rickettsiales bacterium]|tara:strand:- start:12 stop:503 length:492 start_codon:yes stop_codon:yes gene_type:complete
MAFVTEDGTGLAEANSYVSVAEADAYHADRGNAAWIGEDSAKQSALIKATDYLEQTYGRRWKGERLYADQALEWPRTVDALLPKAIKSVTCLLALEAIEGVDLNPTLGRAIKREKVDVIETEFMDNAAPTNTRPAIDGLLLATGYLTSSAAWGVPGNGKVIRV